MIGEEELAAAARAAMKNAYAPYSHYAVGAAVEDERGRIFSGCNIENASYGATMCAERTAVFKAISEGAKRVVRIAIAADGSMPYPCGMCRQVLTEFMVSGGVIILECGGVREKYKLSELMPHVFEM